MVRTIIAVTVVIAAGIPASWAAATEHGSMSQQVQQAKTAADHEALAAQYDKQAAEAKEKAAEHRKMAEAYRGRPAESGGKVFAPSPMLEHCESLAKDYDDQAQMYATMAAAERELAKTAK